MFFFFSFLAFFHPFCFVLGIRTIVAKVSDITVMQDICTLNLVQCIHSPNFSLSLSKSTHVNLEQDGAASKNRDSVRVNCAS